MTDRVNCLHVALERDIREDDVQPLISAILQLRGVLTVTNKTVDFTDWIAVERARADLGQKLIEIVYPRRATGKDAA